MKKAVLLVFIISCMLLSGCYDYEDINRVMLPTLMMIDIDDEGNPIIYMEVFHSYRSNKDNQEKGQRLIYNEHGRSLYHAMETFDREAAYKYNFTQNKMIIFTERAAEEGLKPFIDYIHRHQDMLLRPYIAIFYGEPEEFLNLPRKQNEYMGLFLFDLFDRPAARATIEHKKLFEFLNERRQGNNVIPITALDIDRESIEHRVRKYGFAILKDDKLVDRLTLWETMEFGFLKDGISEGSIEISHPHNSDKNITLKVTNTNTKTHIDYDGEKVNLKKVISLTTSIVGTEYDLDINDEMLNRIKVNAELVIKNECEELFHKYKQKELDIFQIKEEFNRRYPKVEIDNPIIITELDIEFDYHHIEHSMNKKGFR